MTFKDTKKSINCSTEKNSYLLGSFNYIEAIKIPLGVKVYLTFDSDLDYTKAHILTDTFEVFKNKNVYADVEIEGTQIYLHTEGTSSEKLELYCAFVGGNGFFVKNTPLATIDLENDVKQSLAEQHIKSFDNELLTKLDKLINPFDDDSITHQKGYSTATATIATLFEQIMTCDEVIITMVPNFPNTTYTSSCYIYLDSFLINRARSYMHGTYGMYFSKIEGFKIKNIRGKALKLTGNGSTIFHVQEITKKV